MQIQLIVSAIFANILYEIIYILFFTTVLDENFV